jgi:pyruvate/2-oxoglutarate/acetoin dehydrogenase E1 component
MTLTATRRLTQMEATIEAIAQEMRADARVFLIGQDIGPMGGAMQGTRGLFEEFGSARVREAPISESAMVGAAVGAAMFGLRPIVEISFGEFLPAAMSQLINQAPNVHYMTAGAMSVPMVVRTRVGDGPYGGHPQDYSTWFAHVPGLKVVMPASAVDAKGLMTSAIRDPNPVLFFEAMSLSHARREEVPAGEVVVDIGTARRARDGRDATIVSLGSMLPTSVSAAEQLAALGVEAEVIDLRSMRPWDRAAVAASAAKTGRLLYVQEAWPTAGFGAEVLAAVAEDVPGTRVARLGTVEVPVPSGPLRKHALPNADRIVDAVQRLLRS